MAAHSPALPARPAGCLSSIRWRLAALVHGLFPPTCYLCLDPGQPPALDLCAACETDLPWLGSACAACAMPTLKKVDCCERCRAAPHVFDAAFAGCHYEFPVVELIQRLKYHGTLPLARLLGTVLGRRLAGREARPPDVILPVPLHMDRERRRGYNQAREISRFVGAELGLPVADRLAQRIRATAEQAVLPAAERRANLSGAFVATPAVAGLRIAIVDDVLTTGATADALALALFAAGAARVEVWAVARAAGDAAVSRTGNPGPGR